jgi:hypothetical protein
MNFQPQGPSLAFVGTLSIMLLIGRYHGPAALCFLAAVLLVDWWIKRTK